MAPIKLMLKEMAGIIGIIKVENGIVRNVIINYSKIQCVYGFQIKSYWEHLGLLPVNARNVQIIFLMGVVNERICIIGLILLQCLGLVEKSFVLHVT